jgi:hypothetical protein
MRITYINNDNGFNASSPPPSTNKTVVVFSPLGDKGAAGKSAYQYALDAGYTGTEEEFTMLMVSPEFTITDEEAQADWDNINT